MLIINRLGYKSQKFEAIVNEKENYKQMKEKIRNTKSRDELTENSRMIRKNSENL